MHIECLDYFHKVAMTKSISKVANNSHISQSALSQQIQKLEESLGYQLLIRSNKGVELTDMGKVVFKHSENIIRIYEKMQEELVNKDKNNNIIRIEACESLANYSLPCTLFDVKNKFPYHNYELISSFSRNIEENVLNDICDIGFINGKPNDETLLNYKLGTDKIVLIGLSKANIPDKMHIKDLINYPLLILSDKFKIKDILDVRLKDYGYKADELNILFNLDSISAIKSSVSQRHGIAFLPYVAVKKELYLKQFKLIEVVDLNLDYDIYLINKDVDINCATNEFIQYIKKYGKKGFC